MPAPSLVKLDFQEKLIQSGRKENTEAVFKRIKTLHQKLAVLEQETTDTSSLKVVCKQLVSELILHHKDRGVKAYAACCLADSLRICAPNAPYTMDQLRDIFQFFVAQLTSNLKPPPQNARLPPIARNKSITDSQLQSQSQSQSQTQASQRVTEVPYYNEYCYLLESLATIKSASLACDVPDSEEILTGFFDGFTEVVRPDMSKSVIRHLGEILVCLVDEAQTVPAGVLDCIIGQFTEFASRPETPSFQLIVDVCNKTAERLTRPVYAHFSNIQLEHGRNPSQDDLKALAESHTLLLNIFRFSPGLLLNVVPLLEANLKAADEVPLRQLSTKTLGRMFGERPVVGTGRADLAKAYPSAWRAWLGRKVDKALSVRLAWVESTRGILCNHPELRRELEGELIDRIHDADERVRAAICKVIGSLDFETALHHISEETLKAVGGRMSDKRSNVRSEAASALGKLWSLAYTLIESNDADVVAQFAWIPEAMLLSLLKKDVTIELRTQIAHIFKTVILPLPEQKAEIDVQAWVDRLLLVSSHLNTPAFGALKRLTGLIGFARGGSPYRAFVDFCEANNGGVIDQDQDEEKVKARLEFVISAIAQSRFVDVEKARKDMESFAAINEQKLYRLYKVCVDVHSDLQSLVKSRHELRRRLEQHHPDILDTFTTILDVGSWNIINQSSIPPLIAAIQKTQKGSQGETITQAAREWLRLIAKEGALMFKSHIPILVKEMDNKKVILSEAALQGLAAVVKADKESCPTESVLDKAHKLAMEGTPKQAKYASRFLAFTRNADATCSDLVDDLCSKLNVKNKLLVSHLSALAELAFSAAESFETKSDEIMDFVMNEVLAAPSPSANVEDSGLADDWVDESELETMDRAKVVSLRILTHRKIGFARADNRIKIVTPVLKMLNEILIQDGRQSDNTNEGCHARVHMRYRATTCFLKLAKVKDFDKAMSPYFQTIATMTLDPSETVRHRLLIKLSEVLPTQRLLPRWNIIPAMSASDPEPENIALAKSIMQNNIRACSRLSQENKIERIEMPLARLILMVSHLDEEWDLEGMKVRARILELYLDTVAIKDNVDLLYHIAGKIKTVRDVSIPIPKGEGSDAEEVIPEDESEEARKERIKRETTKKNKRVAIANSNLYALSELAQLLIRNKAHQHNWPISTYIHPAPPDDKKEKQEKGNDKKKAPSGIHLPSDIFHNLTDHQAGLDNIRNKFLDDDIADHVKGLGRKGFVAKRVTDRTSPVKRTKVTSKKPRKKSKRTVHDFDDDDDEEEDSDSGSELEEEEGGDVEMEEEGESAGVVGRGGRRGAKTKAKKAVRPKKKRNSKSKSVSVSAEESDLTEEDE